MSDSIDQFLAILRGCAEPTRLRIVAALAQGELTVSELTHVLAQSQPRVSRHIKLLVDAGLVQRHPEGGWIFCRLNQSGAYARLIAELLAHLPKSSDFARDDERLADVIEQRQIRAQTYFDAHATAWDALRVRHIDDAEIEKELARFVPAQSDLLVDLGTGTGRMLEVFAPHAHAAIGFDINTQMLSIARARIAAAGLLHCQVRQGDVQNIPLGDGQADLVILHQVLHFLDAPALALREAGRILRPHGRVVIADFAPHELEFLRIEHVHRRLGFGAHEVIFGR